MHNYPKIVMDETKSTPNDMIAKITTEQYADLLHHTHKVSDLISDSDETQSYDDTEIRELLKGKVDAVEGKSLLDDAEIERLSKVTNFDDTKLREDLDDVVKDLYNKIMGITDEDSTTVDEAYDTLKEVSKFIKEDGEAATEIINTIKAIEETLKGKVNSVEGKSLVDDAEIERLSTLNNYDDTELKKLINDKVNSIEGKSLVDDAEIERLAGLNNYDDTELKESIKNINQYDKETVKSDLVTDNYIDMRGEPYFNEELNCFFANGVPVTVEEDPNNANGVIIKWGVNGSVTIADSSKLYVYGGGDGYVTPKYISRAKVTVNSGYVRCLYAGGCGNSVVDRAEVIINGGTVKNIMGGGRASDPRDAINRSSVVYDSKVVMNGGSCDMLVGGSVGFGIVENVSIIINDGIVNSYLIAGGSNGAVENAYVTINGGTVKLFQSTNRGYVTDVELKVTGGTVNNVYCGGEVADDVDGTIKSFKCDIVGGYIENFAVGTDGKESMNIDKITGTINGGVVTNISDELKNKLQ